MSRLIGPLCALALLSGTASAQNPVLVIDGDSLSVNGRNVRLWGIDAPELDQTCLNGQQAGRIARAFLMHVIDNKPVRCKVKERDRYGRDVSICLNHEQRDISRLMVEAGWAWAFVRYTSDYVEYEIKAMRQTIGVHAMACEIPWRWRQKNGDGGKPVPR